MAVALLVVGMAGVVIGGRNVVRRDAIVARHRSRRRAGSEHAQVPMAYAVSGGLTALAGLLMALAAILQLV